MFNNFLKVNRFPIKSGLQYIFIHISRSYCYKPVERKHIETIKRILNRNQRRFVVQKDDGFNLNVGMVKPAADGGRSERIIEALPRFPSEFDSNILIETFFKLGIAPISDYALIHENFNTLIEATKEQLPQFTTEQNVNIFSQICLAEIPMFDELTEFVVETLLSRVIYMTLRDIIATDYSLRNYYKRELKVSKLFEMLRQTTRTAFVVKVNNALVDVQSYGELMQIVKYLSNNQSLVKNVDISSLSQQLFLIDDHQFQMKDLICVIVSLARVPTSLDECTRQLLSKLFRIWCKRTNNFEDVKEILGLLSTKKSKDSDPSLFQNVQFISHCTKLTIEKNDFRNALIIMNFFNNLSCTSTELIDFLSIIFDSDKIKKLKADDYAIFCTACEIADYKPLNFESKFVPAIQLARIQDLNIHKQIDLALTLNKLGIHHTNFIDYLSKSSAIQVLYKNDCRLDEMNRVYSVAQVKGGNSFDPYLVWLMSDLEKFIGRNKISHNVFLNNELTIPLVMKVNTETGYFMEMEDGSNQRSNLICKNNELIVCVLTQDVGAVDKDFEIMSEIINKQRKLIKQKGFIAITLDESLYGSMQTYKRAFTFFKILLYAINNRRK